MRIVATSGAPTPRIPPSDPPKFREVVDDDEVRCCCCCCCDDGLQVFGNVLCWNGELLLLLLLMNFVLHEPKEDGVVNAPTVVIMAPRMATIAAMASMGAVRILLAVIVSPLLSLSRCCMGLLELLGHDQTGQTVRHPSPITS